MRTLLYALLALALLTIPLLGLWRPPQISLVIEGDELVVRLSGWDAFYALKRELRFPRREVAGVTAVVREQVPRRGLRLPGTQLPGLIRAGSYGRGQDRDFWDVRRGKHVLVIELLPVASYRRLVLEVADAPAEALRLEPDLGAWTGVLRG